MATFAAKSSLEIANWFFKKAENSKLYLEEDKLQTLLFLAQTHYALKNKMQYLFPSLFVCDNNGFFEPNLKKILEFGMPLMGKPEISPKVDSFLEQIWQKYAAKNTFELISLAKNTASYQQHHSKDDDVLVTLEEMTNNFNAPQTSSHQAPKVLISQNGPVVVSKWQPRKINDSKK